MTLKELLTGKLTKKQLMHVPSSFDIVGNRDKAAAIIEVPQELRDKTKLIAEAIMKQHKNVRSVLLKASERRGVYRLRKLKLIAGDKKTVVTHAESGCVFLLDPTKVYFSPREVTERQRVAGLVKPKEMVAVFFSGIGAFPIIIAKKSKAKNVIGIEINPVAFDYFKKNIELNKTENVQVILGDVKERAAHCYGICNRVIMPLPESAVNYLEYAIKCLKNNGVVHLYCFSEEGGINQKAKETIRAIKNLGYACKVSFSKVLPYGPGIYKYRLDITVRGHK